MFIDYDLELALADRKGFTPLMYAIQHERIKLFLTFRERKGGASLYLSKILKKLVQLKSWQR